MREDMFVRLFLIAATVFTLAACGSRDYRPDYVEQTCEEEGSVYWISLVSNEAVAKREAVLAKGDSAEVVERANAILYPTEIKVVFTNQGVSFHGFMASALAVNYKDVTYLRLEDRDGNKDTLVIDYAEKSESGKETTEQGVSGLSSSCIDGLQEYLADQGVTLST